MFVISSDCRQYKLTTCLLASDIRSATCNRALVMSCELKATVVDVVWDARRILSCRAPIFVSEHFGEWCEWWIMESESWDGSWAQTQRCRNIETEPVDISTHLPLSMDGFSCCFPHVSGSTTCLDLTFLLMCVSKNLWRWQTLAIDCGKHCQILWPCLHTLCRLSAP